MPEVLSPATVDWMRARLDARNVDVGGGGIADADLLWTIDSDADGLTVGALTERGGPADEQIRGLPEYVERWFVWSTSSKAPGRRGFDQELRAPWWTTAPGGRLSVRSNGAHRSEVVDGDAVVATFYWGGDATEFTHYGYLPVDLLTQQVDLPPEESVFHLSPMRRSYDNRWRRKNRDAPERIRTWAVRQLAARDETTRRALGAEEEAHE